VNQATHHVAPVSARERVRSLDVLRGFALFGILVVNILNYAPRPQSFADQVTSMAVNVLAEGSFYPLFSLLFGVGFAVFLSRATGRDGGGVGLYLRRVIGLFLIAVFQIVFLEDRNILLRYAFLAIPLLFFWRAGARTCLIAAVIVLGLAIGRGAIHRSVLAWEMADPARAEAVQRQQMASQANVKQRQAAQREAAASGRFIDYAAFRATWRVGSQIVFSTDLRRNPTLPLILSMFLLGAAMWRAEVFSQPERYRRFFIQCAVVGGVAGIGGNVFLVSGPEGDGPTWMATWFTAIAAINMLSNVALMLAYVGCVMLLFEFGRRTSTPLAVIGRMGLTNYLCQSVAMSALFLPYGAALDGKLPYWSMPVVALVIFAPCWPFSAWWLSRFQFGPAEWLWRCFTYGRLQPMRTLPAQSQGVRQRA
jgi:uncharacterized protein